MKLTFEKLRMDITKKTFEDVIDELKQKRDLSE